MTTSANGTHEGPLPSDIPTDADHMIYERKKPNMSNIYESEVEYYTDRTTTVEDGPLSGMAKLKARNTTLKSARDLWRARAQENQLHIERLRAQIRRNQTATQEGNND